MNIPEPKLVYEGSLMEAWRHYYASRAEGIEAYASIYRYTLKGNEVIDQDGKTVRVPIDFSTKKGLWFIDYGV